MKAPLRIILALAAFIACGTVAVCAQGTDAHVPADFSGATPEELYQLANALYEKDVDKAVSYWKAAAELGYAKAQYELSVCYRRGESVPKDDAKAVEWCRKAAEQGYYLAQHNLGVFYQKGLMGEQNPAEAVKWHTLAAEQGFEWALLDLSSYYLNGVGVEKDVKKAVSLLQAAADQGNAEAWYMLGMIYYTGCDEVAQDLVNAVKCLEIASNSMLTAHMVLFECRMTGKGTEQDVRKALIHLRTASMSKDEGALFLWHNFQLYADNEDQLKWLKVSAEGGNGTAARILRALAEDKKE